MNITRTCQQMGTVCIAVCFGLVSLLGCSQQEATEAIKKSEDAIEKAADTVSDEAGQMVEKGKEMAGDMADKGKELASRLSEQAEAYLNPIKEKFSDLDSLKETPEELRTALSNLVQSIEDKAADVDLPESVANSLSSVKEKIVALINYLEGEYEQSQINEKLSEIMQSVKSGFGL